MGSAPYASWHKLKIDLNIRGYFGVYRSWLACKPGIKHVHIPVPCRVKEKK